MLRIDGSQIIFPYWLAHSRQVLHLKWDADSTVDREAVNSSSLLTLLLSVTVSCQYVKYSLHNLAVPIFLHIDSLRDWEDRLRDISNSRP